MVSVKCTHCNVTYINQPSIEHADNQHTWNSDHPAKWETVGR